MRIFILIFTLVFCSICLAGPGHGHSHEDRHTHRTSSLTKVKAQDLAKFHIMRLIKLKKIDLSWQQAIFENAEKKPFKGKQEWLVTFTNIKSKTNKTKLYIFLESNGQFIAANFTGK